MYGVGDGKKGRRTPSFCGDLFEIFGDLQVHKGTFQRACAPLGSFTSLRKCPVSSFRSFPSFICPWEIILPEKVAKISLRNRVPVRHRSRPQSRPHVHQGRAGRAGSSRPREKVPSIGPDSVDTIPQLRGIPIPIYPLRGRFVQRPDGWKTSTSSWELHFHNMISLISFGVC